MNKNEKIEKVEEAQDKLYEAVDLLKQAVGDDRHAKAYLIDQLKILIDSQHGFLDNSFNCEKLIEQLEEDEDED